MQATKRPETPATTNPYPVFYTIALISGVIAAVGVFLPWITVGFFGGSISTNGFGWRIGEFGGPTKAEPRDALIMLGLGVIIFGLSIAGLVKHSDSYAGGIALLGAVCAVFTGYKIYDIATRVLADTTPIDNLPGGTASVGYGIILTAIGGVIACAMGASAYFRK